MIGKEDKRFEITVRSAIGVKKNPNAIALSELAFAIVKWAGATYLVYLGVKLLLKPRAILATAQADTGSPATIRASSGAFHRGFMSNMLNPKVGVFYVTFLPQFIPHGVNVAAFFAAACGHPRTALAGLVRAADRPHRPAWPIPVKAARGEKSGPCNRLRICRLRPQAGSSETRLMAAGRIRSPVPVSFCTK